MDQTVPARIEAIMQNPDQQKAALAAIKQSVYWTSNSCANASFTWLPSITIFDAVRFNSQGQPVAGTWREGIFESGCGFSQQLNVANYVTAPGEVHVTSMLPGTTIASPIMQASAVNDAAYAAGILHGSCDVWYIADTQLVGPEGPAAADGSETYKEYWTVNVCGALKRTVLHFQILGPNRIRVRADRHETTILQP